MEERYESVKRFLDVCTELVEGKYITADTKISEILQALAASKELTELFTAVTREFDYAAARRAYLKFPSGPGAAHGAAYLPSDRREILAFVFCLLVEFDAGTLLLDDFLLRYFYVDGSYTASYLIFADRLIRPFRDIVCDCFPAATKSSPAEERGRRQEELMGRISELLPLEQSRLLKFGLRAEEQAAAGVLLAGITSAIGRKDIADLAALLAGYKYFLRYFGGEDETSTEVFSLASQL